MSKIFVHIVTWNSAEYIERCIKSLYSQEQLQVNRDIFIQVTDNASSDKTKEILQKFADIKLNLNSENIGFCAAHNQGAQSFLESDAEYFLILNPDTELKPDSLIQMLEGFKGNPNAGILTPKLLRFSHNEIIIDATGIELTADFRHFDRGSGEKDAGQYDKPEFVFGGTGACLMLVRSALNKLLIEENDWDSLYSVYPVLINFQAKRAGLFDEAFFAYREDAELSFRAQSFGLQCLYWPKAVVSHVRRVLPERRSELPKEINLHGVRNRFLLQILYWTPSLGLSVFIRGIVFRNLLVLLGVLIKERSSLEAFVQLRRLRERAYYRKEIIQQRATPEAGKGISEWFKR